MEQTTQPTEMVFYNFNHADGTITPTSTPVQIEFGSADVARQINQQVQLQYSNLNVIQPGQTQQIVITTQPTYDSIDNLDPLLIKNKNTRLKGRGDEPRARVPCDVCGKTFSCNANLRDHARLHTGERPFRCSECDMTFAQRSNWRLHKRIHTGERPYMCGICGMTFSRSSHLPGHIRVHTGERPFTCEFCMHTFASGQALKNHQRTHTGERPFKCEICSTSFSHSSSLSSHKKRCTGQKRKRGRPIGQILRKKRKPINRPRGRPKKRTRFKRVVRPEDSVELNTANLKEEQIEVTDGINVAEVDGLFTNGNGGSIINENGTMNQGNISIADEQNEVDPIMCNITENEQIDEYQPNEDLDVKPNVNVLNVLGKSEDMIDNHVIRSGMSDMDSVSSQEDGADICDDNLSVTDGCELKQISMEVNENSDLRQEAAVTMATLHHSVVTAEMEKNYKSEY